MRKITFLLFLVVTIYSCNQSSVDKQFILMSTDETNIDFVNEVKNKNNFNIFNYRNFYNGGGVAIGDINNDGLADIFLTANMGSNKLYLNKGDWQFDDISEKAGIEETNKWSTGIAMVDINADGFLDIYVCNAGYNKDLGQGNALFINNGDLTFTESAKNYGLDDDGYTTHAGFFDYDLDGDLDVYLLNNSFIPVNTLNYSNKRDLRAKDWPVKDFLKGGGDKLLRNDDGQFTDVSEEANIFGSLIGFGLGVTIGDVNGDHYPDIYISNDFFERDYLYINQQDGTFKEDLLNWAKHISLSSMGADMADINNDGYQEVFVTDMLPDDEYRLKTTASYESINTYELKQKKGFYHQYMQNTLHLNDQNQRFQEIGYYSGVAASDWSWGALLFDMDNDAFTDIYVCNGIYHDVINQDFIDFFANDIIQKMTMTGKKEAIDSVINKMPSIPISNKAFRNTGGLKFEDITAEWGIDKPSFSNGAAYGDLDNDGDLDMVINNVNEPTMIYQNQSDKLQSNHYLAIQLKAQAPNVNAIGAKVLLYVDDQVINRQLIPTRGFQSSMDYKMTIGLGKRDQVDSLKIIWPNQKITKYTQLGVDTLLKINYQSETVNKIIADNSKNTLLQQVDNSFDKHQEDKYIDFYYERNIPLKTSQEGPRAAIGDVNGDGKEDVYIAGAVDQAGQLYLQTTNGFEKKEQNIFSDFAAYEETAVLFFDADGDQDLDLFVGSGGNHRSYSAVDMQDRLYLNTDGKGNFELKTASFSRHGMNSAVAIAHDYDNDGDQDLFVGSRSVPKDYGTTPLNFIYQNDGKANFKDLSTTTASAIKYAGMVTDAEWVDVMGDPQKELLVVGEWMSPKVYSYDGTKFNQLRTDLLDIKTWCYDVTTQDIDGDGDQDLFLGNVGENFHLKASKNQPLKLWMKDFDKNGATEKIITKSMNGKDIPIALKREITDQLVSLKKDNTTHEAYANKTIQDLFDAKTLEETVVKEANYLSSCIAINQGDGHFEIKKLPELVQLSSTNAATFVDVNGDQKKDLVLGGNNYDFLPQFSRLDASFGHTLINKGDGTFDYLAKEESGFFLDGEVKQISYITINNEGYILSLINDEQPVLHKLSQ